MAVTFVSGATRYQTGTLALTSAQAGDIALIIGEDNTAVSCSAGWTQYISYTDVGGFFCRGFYRIIQAGDSAPTVTLTSGFGGAQIAIYRGANALALKTTNTGTTTATLTITGFVKNYQSLAVITQVMSRTDTAVFPTTPTSFTLDVSGNSTSIYFTWRTARLASGSYTNNASVAWTSCDTTYETSGVLIELFDVTLVPGPAWDSGSFKTEIVSYD